MSVRFTMSRSRSIFFALALTGFAVSGCDSNGAESSEPLEATEVLDLAATTPGHYTFYSLRENRVVPTADSASTRWDLAFSSTMIRTNSGVSGPGQGGALILEDLFEEVTEAPETGYSTDTQASLAIPAGSGVGWYNYSGAPNHLITPIPGRVLIVRTADGKYAKVRILNYYKGRPAELPADGAVHPSRHYSFEFIVQPDGSRNLE